MRDGVIITPPQTAVDPRRHQPQGDHPDRPRPRLRGRRARHRARRAVPGRGGVPHRHGSRAGAGPRGRRPRGRHGQPGRDHARPSRRAFQDALHGRAPSATASGSIPCRCPRRSDVSIELYDATLRDGMQGEGLSLTAAEKLRVAHASTGSASHLIEAGFPASNPKEVELFDLLAREQFDARADRGVRDDPAPRRDRGRRSGPAGAGRLLRARLHDRRQDVGRCTWRRSSASTARRTSR